jgi:hypothetical protein
MATVRKFLAAILSDWLARMSGPLTVPFTMAALLLPSTKGRVLFAVSAVIAALITCYRIWAKEYERAEAEKKKNDLAPKINISVYNTVPHGSLDSGITDLFVYMVLVLEEPSEVSIQSFSLSVFTDAQSLAIAAAEDVLDWEIIKKEGDGRRSHVPCAPLVKELTRRGDPVQGWIHFPIPHWTESVFQKLGVTIKLNCAHGTCYFQLNGGYVHADPDRKGFMRRISAS